MVGNGMGGQHPYEAQMDRFFPEILMELLGQGRILQNEYQLLMNEYPRVKPIYLSKIMAMGSLDTNWLRCDMRDRMIGQMIRNIRGNYMTGGGYNNGGSMFNGGMSGMNMYQQAPAAYNPYASQMPNYSTQVMPPQQTFQQQPAPTPAPQPAPQPTPQPKQPVEVPAEWSKPTPNMQIGGKVYEDMGTLSIASKYWNRSNGRVHLDVLAFENSLKHKSKYDALEAVKRIPDLMRQCNSYTITVGYLQPVLLEVSLKEMQALADELVREIGSSTGSLDTSKGVANIGALKKIIENKYTNALNREVVRFLCDEINAHQNGGELCDSAHPIPPIDVDELGVLEAYASRNVQVLGQGVVDDINNTQDFDSALSLLIAKVITPFIARLKSFIIDPKASIEYLETYVNACPRYVTKDGQKYAAVPDIVKLYHQSKQHVNGSPTESAKKAKLDFETALGVLVSKYTVLYVPRIATFSNLDPGQAIWFSDDGNIRPKCYLEPTNDLSFFLTNIITRVHELKSDLFSRAPYELEFHNDETVTKTFYGVGTDQCIWTGNEMYFM